MIDLDEREGVSRRELVLAGAAAAGSGVLGLLGCAGGGRTAGSTAGAPPRPEKEAGAMKNILILGAGFGGLEAAAGLSAGLGEGYAVTLVDRNDSFFIGATKIDVLLGRRGEAQVRDRYADRRAQGVRFVQTTVTAIDTDARTVATGAGPLPYDYLIVALGADLDPDATPGFRDSGGYEFYSMPGAVRLAPVLAAFSSGTLVLGVLGTPYKCPPAPYEVACQVHDRLVRDGVRDRSTIKMVIPTPRPVPSPGVSDALERLLAERSIELVRAAPITAIDAARKQVVHGAGTLGYDLFVGVPVHVAPAVVRASRLADGGFVEPDPVTLQTRVPGVYAIGDCAKLPAGDLAVPKAGVFAEDAARTVVSDILAREGRGGGRVKFRAHGACYLEVGAGLAGRIEADFFGGDKPKMEFFAPSAALYADKLAFETSRRRRWFRTP